MNYWDRILAARTSGAMPRAAVHICTIEHSHSCTFYCGGGCNCVPDISIVTADGVYVLDEHGVGKRVTRQ